MAYLTQFGTATTSNTNLNTTTLIGTFTNTTRIRKLYLNIFADQVKGNGDYKASITVQRAGAGVFYQSIITTNTVAAGVTSILFNSIAVTLNATDVMKVYLLGLSTDNDTTADVTVDVNEEWIDIDASGGVVLSATQASYAPAKATDIVSGGAITTSGGVANANLAQILGATITGTAAYLVASFTKFFNIQTPTGTVNSLPDALPSAASGLPLKSDLPAAAPSASVIAGAVLDEAKGAHTGLIAKALPDFVPSNINGLPIKSDLPAAAPDVNAIADQVWNEAIAGHLNVGSTGKTLNTAGAATDPLLNPVPGTYAAGTAGAALGSITTGKITVTSPMSQDGLAVKLVRGDDYLSADGRALVWTDSGSQWPNLTGATVKFKWVTFSKSCTVIGAGGAHQQVSLDLTSAETDVMQNGYFDIEATLSNTHVVTIVVAGSLIIRDDV